MRDLPEEMVARIESGAATLCHAWVLTSADGEALGFTDHDRDLTLDGVVCKAASGWTAGAAETEAGLAGGNLAVGGALDSDALTETDIAAGVFDRRLSSWAGAGRADRREPGWRGFWVGRRSGRGSSDLKPIALTRPCLN